MHLCVTLLVLHPLSPLLFSSRLAKSSASISSSSACSSKSCIPPLQAVGFVNLCSKLANPFALAIIRLTSFTFVFIFPLLLFLLLHLMQPIVPSLHCILPSWRSHVLVQSAASNSLNDRLLFAYILPFAWIFLVISVTLLPHLLLFRLALLHAMLSLQIVFPEPRKDSQPAVFTPVSRLISLDSLDDPPLCMLLSCWRPLCTFPARLPKCFDSLFRTMLISS